MTAQPRYNIPHISEDADGMHRTECMIKRSLFICSTAHAHDVPTARAFVERIKKEFPDATHNCWAFAVGPPGHTAHVGFSDDGEPHGTAGRPMLTALLHSNVGELVCVVTRFFGGIKLGSGGLVRAYQGSVLENLQTLPQKERVVLVHMHVIIEYAHLDRLRRLLPDFEAKVMEESFTADAAMLLHMPQEYAENFRTSLMDLTDGVALLEVQNSE